METSDARRAAFEERASLHFSEHLTRLLTAIDELTSRVSSLEAVERRLNYPTMILLASILAVLLYIAHRLP